MKFCRSLLFVLLFVLIFAPLTARTYRPKLVVMEVVDESELFSKEELESIAEYMRGQFAASGKFVVIARERQKKEAVSMLRKKSYKMCRDKSCQIPLGQSLSADTMLIGKITLLMGRYTFTVELVDLAQEATVEAASYNFKEKSETLAVLDKIIAKLSGQKTKKAVVVKPVFEDTPLPPKRSSKSKTSANKLWKKVLVVLHDDDMDDDDKEDVLEAYLKRYPRSKRAKKALEEQEGSYVLELTDSYRTKTEWFSLHFVAGNYGVGGSFSFFTVRWRYFYWEIARFQGAGFVNSTFTATANGKTMLGFPLFLSSNNRHELRFGVGFSAGISEKDSFAAFINIPFEVSYVFHAARKFALQTGLSLEFPAKYDDNLWNGTSASYTPIFNFFIGFRN